VVEVLPSNPLKRREQNMTPTPRGLRAVLATVFALALAVVAVAGLARRRLVAVPALIAVLIALPVGTAKGETSSDGARVIREADTEYQYARVIQRPDGRRDLELNEGQAIHSTIRPGTFLTDDYWDDFLVAPFAALDGPPRRVAILGNAAGTTARAYGHYFPETSVDGVEIDGELSRIGRELFDLRGPRLRLHTADARPFLRTTDERYDAIFVDAYRQPYIPFYLATKEFFELVRSRLTPEGVVLVNVGHPEGDADLERVLGRTMADVFPTVLRDPTEPTNTVMLATGGDASGEKLRAAIGSLPRDVRERADEVAARLAPRLRGGSVYTDDRAPVEWLIDASIVKVAARGER